MQSKVTYVDIINLFWKPREGKEFYKLVKNLGENPRSIEAKPGGIGDEFFQSGLLYFAATGLNIEPQKCQNKFPIQIISMPKTQTPKVTYLIASLILCAQFVLPPSAYSEPLPEEQSKSHKHCRTDLIFYGRGILTSSKCYFFQSLGEDSIPKELQKVKEGDPSFTATARWVRNHILAILNRPNHATEQVSSCALHLYTYDSQGELALLMTVPLGPKQLGPDYLKDINELRSTMNSQNLLNKEK